MNSDCKKSNDLGEGGRVKLQMFFELLSFLLAPVPTHWLHSYFFAGHCSRHPLCISAQMYAIDSDMPLSFNMGITAALLFFLLYPYVLEILPCIITLNC